MNSIITAMKRRVEEGINSRITKAEEQISNLEDRMVKITTVEQNKENKCLIKQSLMQKDFCGHVQRV